MCTEYWSFEIDICGNPNLETSHLLREVMILKNSSKIYRKPLKYMKSVSLGRYLDFDEPLFLKAASRSGGLRNPWHIEALIGGDFAYANPCQLLTATLSPTLAHSLSHDNDDELKTLLASLHNLSYHSLHMLPLSLWSCVPV